MMEHKSSDDVISSMPENVVTNILNRLPIQDAVRTCVLSQDWRLKWTLVTKVSFDGISRYLEGIGPQGKYRYDGNNVMKLLCHLQGPVSKFVFTIPNNMELDVKDINHWILLLAAKGIKEISLINKHETPLMLPTTNLFSCPELRYLNLLNCCLHSPSTDLINLLSLELDQVTVENDDFGEIITHAPFLEILKISYHDPIGKVKLVDLAKLKNLKTLHIPLCMIDENTTRFTSWSVFQLGVYLPKLQELNLYFHNCKFPEDVSESKWVSTIFPCLKTLTLYPVDFSSCGMLLCVIGMIWRSPNLQHLKITASCNYSRLPIACFSSELDDNVTRQLQQLRHVVFTSLNCSSTEVDLIKHLLVCSPSLKKIVIHTRMSLTCSIKRKFSTTLLMFPRASPNAQMLFLDERIWLRRSAIDKQPKITRMGIANNLTIALNDLEEENESPDQVARAAAPLPDNNGAMEKIGHILNRGIRLARGDPPPQQEITDYDRLIKQEIETIVDTIHDYKDGQVKLKDLSIEIIISVVNIIVYVMQAGNQMEEEEEAKAKETGLALDV